MTADRRTKAQLLAELDMAGIATTAERDAREQQEMARQRERAARDVEAVAIEACIQALQVIEPATQLTSSFSSTYTRSPGPKRSESPSLERALSYLRQRFGLPDATRHIEDLQRKLDEANQRAFRAEQQLEQVRHDVGRPS